MDVTRQSAFMQGGGVMGAKVRAYDWAATSLGPIDAWPAALRISVDQLLASKFPACLFWGPDLIAIYNDGYTDILGAKPEALGQPLRVTWQEAWPQLRPIAEKALAGESTFIEDYPMRIDRNGAREEAWFTFSYGPVFDAEGRVVGMLNTVVETSAQQRAERRVREERARERRLLQHMPGFVATLAGPEHVFEYVNDAFIAIAGERDYIGHAVRDVFPELHDQGYVERMDEAYATGQPFRAQALPIQLMGAGAERFLDLLYQPIRNARGQVEGLLVGGYDVTERVQAEASLRAFNADLEQRVVERTLARGRAWQVSPELLCVANRNGFLETINPAWEKTLGWTEAELTRTPFRDFVHPDDAVRTQTVWADIVERGQPMLRFENRCRTRRNDWRWLSWVGVPEDGKVYCIARDVTAEKERARELALRTAERDLLATIVQTTDAFLQVLDMDYRFLAINEANRDEYQRVFGRRPVVGDSLMEVLDGMPAERDAALALWGRVMGGESFTVQHAFGQPGARRHYDMKFEVLRAPDGYQIGAFLTSTDITERVHEQRALAEAQEALRQSQKMEAVGQLTGGLAHDFNNLLAAIGGALQVVRLRLAQGQRDGLEHYLDMGERSVQRAAALTQRLLAFSRRQTLDPKPTDVDALVQGMSELIARTVGPAVQVGVCPTPGLWPTRVDPSQLENALLNLCINARDAMPQGGRLTLATARLALDAATAAAYELEPGDYVTLEVADTGAGMPPAVAQRVFEPFFTTKPLGQGTGLGLSMVYGFVRQSGGQVLVESQVGVGTRMVLYLPRHLGEVVAGAPARNGAAPPAGRGETLLLIEDEETVRELLVEMLTESGYSVLSAADGPSGLRRLQAPGPIDLLITDVGLPGGMNGRQVADAGRALRPQLKVLFITGYAESAAVGNGLMDDGMEVMTKPFDIAALVARVGAMVEC